MEPLYRANQLLEKSGLEPELLSLVHQRASQINGCAFCLALHWREAQALGEKGDRINGLAAWHEAPWYSERERAALEWTEALTLVAQTHVPDDVYARVSNVFSPEELVYLTLAITTINSWNRFAIAFRVPPARADETFAWLQSQKKHGAA